MASNKREYNRSKKVFNVRIAKRLKEDNFRDLNIDYAKAIDLSASGVLISITEPIKIGEIIRVTFLKPNTFEFFEGLGRVIRIEDNKDGTYFLGINFIDLDKNGKEKLNYYIGLFK